MCILNDKCRCTGACDDVNVVLVTVQGQSSQAPTTVQVTTAAVTNATGTTPTASNSTTTTYGPYPTTAPSVRLRAIILLDVIDS